MKKSLYLLLTLALFSCKSKPHEPEEYMHKALLSDEYKNAYMNFNRVRSGIDSVKKGTVDSNNVIFIYNNSIASPTAQVKTMAQVEQEIKKDTGYLKAVQLKVANDMATAASKK